MAGSDLLGPACTVSLGAPWDLGVWEHRGIWESGSTVGSGSLGAPWDLGVWEHRGIWESGSTVGSGSLGAPWGLGVWEHRGDRYNFDHRGVRCITEVRQESVSLYINDGLRRSST